MIEEAQVFKLKLARECGDFDCALSILEKKYELGDEHAFLHPLEKDKLQLLKGKRVQSFLLGKEVGKSAFAAMHPEASNLSSYYVSKGVLEHPVLHTPFPHNLHLSVSHSENIGAAICFPEEHPMGIDIETYSHIKIAPVKKHSTPEEWQLFVDHFGDEKLAAIYLWTIKEAMSKVIKTGLMIDFKYLEVKTFEEKNGVLESYFTSFYQYKAFTFTRDNWVCSLVFPYKTNIDLAKVLV